MRVELWSSGTRTHTCTKWPLAGQLAGTDFGNTCARHDAQKCSVFAMNNFGWIRHA